LKALFIGSTPEDNKNIIRLMGNNFPKVQMVICQDPENLMEFMTNDGPFSFVVVSIDNKSITVVDIYQQIIDTLGVRPFVFIGTMNSVKSQLTNDMVHNQQTNALVELPLILDELKKAVNLAIDWVKKEEFEESILEFSREDLHPMRLRNFYLFEQVPYDVYIELTATKFGKVISKDKFYTHQLIQNYSRKNIKYLYLRKDEHLKFLDVSIKNLLKIYEAKLSEKKKYALLHLKTAFFMHQFIKAASVSDEVNKLAHCFIDSVSNLVRSYESLSELLDTLSESGNNMTFAEQSVATAYVCEKLLLNMGWTADMTRGKLILASLLQDVTLSNDDLIKIRSINDPNLKMFSEEEQEDFKNHPQKTANLATFFNGFSDVDFILMEQHEHPTGDGFPKGLNSSGLTTISCIFILASNFVSRMAQTPRSPTQHKEILTNMKRVYNTGNFKDPLKAMEKALKK
jgi:HD-GYP domain-containing protein (c-di-GMP phosphodiesterase class II)